jgi:hypothetical protein
MLNYTSSIFFIFLYWSMSTLACSVGSPKFPRFLWLLTESLSYIKCDIPWCFSPGIDHWGLYANALHCSLCFSLAELHFSLCRFMFGFWFSNIAHLYKSVSLVQLHHRWFKEWNNVLPHSSCSPWGWVCQFLSWFLG